MTILKNINYIAAIIFIVLWCIGFLGHLAGDSIHFLFLGAFILMLFNVLDDDHSKGSFES